jgi:hypothetical protein
MFSKAENNPISALSLRRFTSTRGLRKSFKILSTRLKAMEIGSN